MTAIEAKSVKREVGAAPARAPTLDLLAFTPYRIVVLGREMSEALGAAYSNEGLTIHEWRVLAVISQSPRQAARDVVARTPLDKMAVSRAAAGLEEKGFVLRESCPSDKRLSYLSLTDPGRVVFTRVAKIALDYEARLLAHLSDKERAAFDQILAKLGTAAQSSKDWSP